MSLSVEVPWHCTCCVPACTASEVSAFVKNLSVLEYLQIYYAEEITINGSYEVNERVDFVDPLTTYSQYRVESDPISASNTIEQLPACYKSVSASNGVTNGVTFTYVFRDSSPDYIFYVDGSCSLSAELWLNKVGSTLSLHAVASINSPVGARFPLSPASPGTSTGGDIDFTIQGQTVTGVSIGNTGFGEVYPDEYTSESNATLDVSVTLATPP
jgi:hypothetical protein